LFKADWIAGVVLAEIDGAFDTLSRAPNGADIWRRTAFYVDRILEGAKAADLPVQNPTKFELVVNLKTAKAFGIELPLSLLMRIDEAIE
jgi:ABC-type uncharacterized transport system substrate-binding protein